MAKSHWHRALRSSHKSCTCSHVSWKRSGWKRELVAAPWTFSRWFSHVLWLKVHSQQLLRACLLGSKRKLLPSACQVRLGLASVVCHPWDMQFPGTVYICNQGPLSSAWAHCISCAPSTCSHCRKCCRWTLQEVQARTTDHDLRLSCIYSQSILLHYFFPSQEPPDIFLERFSNDNKVFGIDVLPGDSQNLHDKASSTYNDEEQWAEYQALMNTDLPFQTLHCTPHEHWHGSAHWHTFLVPVTHSTPPYQIFSIPNDLPRHSDQTSSPGLWKPGRVSYWQLDTFLAAAWQQILCLLCLCLGQSQTGNSQWTPTVWWGHPQSSPGLSLPAVSA